jgi:hypothetical protein
MTRFAGSSIVLLTTTIVPIPLLRRPTARRSGRSSEPRCPLLVTIAFIGLGILMARIRGSTV